MPGQPKFHELSQEIEGRGAADGVTGDEYVFDRLRGGETPGAIAKSLDVSRGLLYKWRDASQERRSAWAAAMKDSAEARAEDAGELLDELVGTALTPAGVSLARERASHRRWMAGVLDPDTYAPQQAAAGVTINIQGLHLDALRQYGRMRPVESEQPLAIGSGD